MKNFKRTPIKILNAVLTVLLSFVFCLAFVACEDENSENNQNVAQLIQRVSCGVVEIQAEARLGAAQRQGSGFIVSAAEGGCAIITNYHVIEGDRIVRVRFFGEEEYREATVRGYNQDFDTAVLLIDYLPAKYHVFAFAAAPVLGQEVVSLGYSSSQLCAYSGIVSSSNKWVQKDDEWCFGFQTDFAAAYGTSGGPCLDKKGNVVGLNRLNYVDDNAKDEFLAGVSYKVSAPIVAALFTRITESEFAVADPALGLKIFSDYMTITLFEGSFDIYLSPAGAIKIKDSDCADFAAGEVIVAANGKQVDFCGLIAQLILTGNNTQIDFQIK